MPTGHDPPLAALSFAKPPQQWSGDDCDLKLPTDSELRPACAGVLLGVMTCPSAHTHVHIRAIDGRTCTVILSPGPGAPEPVREFREAV